MLETAQEKDRVTEFYKANARHNRQLKVLLTKTLCKVNKKDIERIRATRAARDSAVAALSFAQVLQHVEKIPREKAEALTAAKAVA